MDGDQPAAEDVERFVVEGVIGVREAVSRPVAEECEALLLADVGIDPDDPTTWTQPVVRVVGRGGGPFTEAATSERLAAATEAVVGAGRWVERKGIGTFPIRVPHPDEPGDDGWHIDASLPPEDDPTSTDYLRFGVNARSDGRALLWLMLFSEVGPDDAPTRLRLRSHLEIARHVAPGGDACTSPYPLPPLDHLPVALATGSPGDVFLCHPFLVHAAQRHQGTAPRVIAQPGVAWAARPDPDRPAAERNAVEEAIRRAQAPVSRGRPF
ncbi:phytanoyl-CoA dioxygenase [Iamia sp. SCSIO 61187]|nr:phytanoyl-CoA dioxygenase [Iamia sp. SCSIO 61187]